MSWTASWRTFASAALLSLAGCIAPPDRAGDAISRSAPVGLLQADDFQSLDQWVAEAEQPARVRTIRVQDRFVLDIDTPAGLTLWFRPRLEGPVTIEFEATAVSEGGPNDAVSDLNVFWMATNRDGSPPFPSNREGRFAAYDDLRTYYVGLGGNRNTTSRFRRYVGEPGRRPLRPEHDLTAPEFLLVPNKKQKITLVADKNHIEYKRDGRVIFSLEDDSPYESGWFALRTTQSHLRIERLRVHRIAQSVGESRQ